MIVERTCKVYIIAKILLLSLRAIPRINLRDFVWFEGKKYLALNGTRHDKWKLTGLQNDDEGWVPRNECRKSYTPRNLFFSYYNKYRFFMDYWYVIWVRKAVDNWRGWCPWYSDSQYYGFK